MPAALILFTQFVWPAGVDCIVSVMHCLLKDLPFFVYSTALAYTHGCKHIVRVLVLEVSITSKERDILLYSELSCCLLWIVANVGTLTLLTRTVQSIYLDITSGTVNFEQEQSCASCTHKIYMFAICVCAGVYVLKIIILATLLW